MNPQAIEFMEREIVLASERYVGKSVFPQEMDGVQIGAYLLVTLDGNSEDEVDALIEQAAELVLEAGAIDVLVADTSAKMKDAWAARSSFLEAIMEETKLLDECDVVVPVNKIAEYLTFVNKTGEECGLVIKSFGHAGDGNLVVAVHAGVQGVVQRGDPLLRQALGPHHRAQHRADGGREQRQHDRGVSVRPERRPAGRVLDR